MLLKSGNSHWFPPSPFQSWKMEVLLETDSLNWPLSILVSGQYSWLVISKSPIRGVVGPLPNGQNLWLVNGGRLLATSQVLG